jgi:hypothetical protein
MDRAPTSDRALTMDKAAVGVGAAATPSVSDRALIDPPIASVGTKRVASAENESKDDDSKNAVHPLNDSGSVQLPLVQNGSSSYQLPLSQSGSGPGSLPQIGAASSEKQYIIVINGGGNQSFTFG